MTLSDRLSAFKNKVGASCTLIAVSKTHPAELIQEAYDAGHRVFGENKVQELVAKYEVLPKDIQWHMIGHLQSNKVKFIVPFIHLIHSVDSFKLLEEINKQAQKVGRIVPCLLQVHIAKEETKFGFSPEEIFELLTTKAFESLTNIKITGLMGMATFTDNKTQVRQEFEFLGSLSAKLKAMKLPSNMEMRELSMGMSGDYEEAIACGSTMIRVGSSIFGNRDYNKAS